MGTHMFSVNGKNTTPIYVVFAREDPIQIEEKIVANASKKRTKFTGDKVAGVPCTRQ